MAVIVVVIKSHFVVTTISCYCIQRVRQLLPMLQVILLLQILLDAVRILEFVLLNAALLEIRRSQIIYPIKHGLILFR